MRSRNEKQVIHSEKMYIENDVTYKEQFVDNIKVHHKSYTINKFQYYYKHIPMSVSIFMISSDNLFISSIRSFKERKKTLHQGK